MACQRTPTATLFGTSVVTTTGVSTIVSTQLVTVTVDGVELITTCIPAPPVGNSSATCVPTVITSSKGSISKCCTLSGPTPSSVFARLRGWRLHGCCVPSAVPPYYCTATDSDHVYPIHPPTLAYSESSSFINSMLTNSKVYSPASLQPSNPFPAFRLSHHRHRPFLRPHALSRQTQ